jgi:S-DNA-T family DNA segregation ATPase FtsK/SpoIIIE
VPKHRPGRGLSHQKQHFLAGVPRIDGIRSGDDPQAGVGDLVKQVKRAWRFEPCPKVPR